MYSFDKFKLGSVYDRGRSLPRATWHMWRNLILHYAPRKKVKAILDLGCGTGRFSVLLSKAYQVPVFGVDPGPGMLAAAKKIKDPKIRFIKGSAEEIPLRDGSVDLVFMSMMFHLVRDRRRMFKEIKRVLRPGGYVLLRHVTREIIDLREDMRFFPESQKIAKKITLKGLDLRRIFEKHFCFVAHKRVKQLVATSFEEYYERTAFRASSPFQLIPKRVFEKRLEEFRKYCLGPARRKPAYECRDLFVFRRY